VMLMSIAEDLKDLILLILLLLLVSFTWFIVLPIVIQILHPPEEVLNKFLILSQIAAAIGTIIMALVTTESVKTMREVLKVEKLRDSFKAIAKELHRAKEYVERNLWRIEEMLKTSAVVFLEEILLGGGNTSKDAIRKDFELHYRKGLKLLKYIEKCNSKIEEYNKKYDEFRDWLKRSIVEKLKEIGVGVDPNGLTHVCAVSANDEWKILFVSPKECQKKFPTTFRVLGVYDHVEAVLMGLNRVMLGARKSEEELSKELTSLYREIRASDEFRRYLNDLKSMVESEVKYCLEKLRDELDKVMDDILQRYTISKQEIVAKEG